MPRQANRSPYTKTLTALLKPDLVRLCNEFHLPHEGSVVLLRTRLKDYLNLHRDNLYRNPQYNALFPKHRRIKPNIPAPTPARSLCSSPTLSDHSSDESFASWNGIDDQEFPQQLDEHQDNPPFHDDLPVHDSPPPSPPPSPAASIRNSPPLILQAVDGRKFLLPSL